MLSQLPASFQRLLAYSLPILSLVLAYFLVVPRYLAFQADATELERTNKLARAKQQLIAEQAQSEPDPLVAQLPANRDEPARFWRQLTGIAKSHGVRFVNVTTLIDSSPVPSNWAWGGGADAPEAGQLKLPPGTVPVTLQIGAEGKFEQLVTFFNNLETFPRLISITEVTMNGSQYPKLTAQFRLTRYTGPVSVGPPGRGSGLPAGAASNGPRS